MHTGLAAIAYERNRLDEARSHLEAGQRLGAALAFPRDPCRSRLVRARLLAADGDLDGALPLLAEAERLYLAEFSPDVRPVAAVRARLLTAAGRLGEARAWADRAGIAPTDDLTFVDEYAHTTLARLLVAEASAGDAAALPGAMDLLDRLRAAAEAGERAGSRLEILIVQALAREGAGDRAGALEALDAAIALAAPDGYVRVFLDEGSAMIRLLKAAARRSGVPAYLADLARAAAGTPEPATARKELVEPLSERELEVLRLLATELSGPEIASRLFVSVNTLRTHTKHIFTKLDVNTRRSAVRRAEDLGLL
jgi:LuxR family maltose regulon positive regulatory protein